MGIDSGSGNVTGRAECTRTSHSLPCVYNKKPKCPSAGADKLGQPRSRMLFSCKAEKSFSSYLYDEKKVKNSCGTEHIMHHLHKKGKRE